LFGCWIDKIFNECARRQAVRPISEIIAERILQTVIELSALVLADDIMTDEVKGIHALHLLRLLNTSAPAAPPTVVWSQREGSFIDLTERVEPPKAPKQKNTGPRKGHPAKFTDAMVIDALDKCDGNVAKAAKSLGCSRVTIYHHRQRSGKSPKLSGRASYSRHTGVKWNGAARSKPVEIAGRNPRPPMAEIAASFGTTENAVQTAMSRFGITRINPAGRKSLTPRNCMSCNNPFMSEGIGSRRCPRCVAGDSEIAA
jgi:hypothetical protein